MGKQHQKILDDALIAEIWRAIGQQQEKISRAKAEIERLKGELRILGIDNPQTF